MTKEIQAEIKDGQLLIPMNHFKDLEDGKYVLIKAPKKEPDITKSLFKGCPVMVRDKDEMIWHLRFFVKIVDGANYPFHASETLNIEDGGSWKQCRLPTPSESPRNILLAHDGSDISKDIEGLQGFVVFRDNKLSKGLLEAFRWTHNKDNSDIMRYMILEDVG